MRLRSARGGGAFGARAARGRSGRGEDPGPCTAEAADATAIRRAALALLGRREYGAAELRERLGAKFDDAPAIDGVLERLVDERLLDDTRFVEAFIRMHRRKGHGPSRILHELAQRGVDPSLAERLVDPRGEDWIDLARNWRERRFGAALPAGVEWQRQARHLQTRGFSTEQVRRALRKADD